MGSAFSSARSLGHRFGESPTRIGTHDPQASDKCLPLCATPRSSRNHGLALVVLIATCFVGVVFSSMDLNVVRSMASFGPRVRKVLAMCPVKNDTIGPPEATFVISCGNMETDAVAEMQPLITSILVLASAPVRLVFFTDAKGVERIRDLFGEQLKRAKKRVWVDIHHLEDKVIDDWALRIQLEPNNHHSGRWSGVKLMIPWLVPNIKRAVVLDTDMVLVDDPIRLWEQFHDVDTMGWTYKMPSSSRGHWTLLCSCVVLINLERARAQKLYPSAMHAALKSSEWFNEKSGRYMPNGDQGIYWLMMRMSPKMFGMLPDRWNRDHCHEYGGAFKPTSTRKVSVLHRNCASKNSSSFVDQASPFFDFFVYYKWHWLQPSQEEVGFDVKVFNFLTIPVE